MRIGGRAETTALAQPSSRRSLFKAVVAGYLNTALSAIAVVVFVPVFARIMGAAAFGVWLTFYSLNQWLSLTISWLNPPIVRMIIREGQAANAPGEGTSAIAGTTLGLHAAVAGVSLLIGAVLWASSPGRFGEIAAVQGAAVIATLWIALQIMSQAFFNFLVAARREHLVHAASIVATVGGGGAAMVAATFGDGELAWVAGGYALVALVIAVGAALVVFRQYGWAFRSIRSSRRVAGELVRGGKPYAWSGLATLLMSSDLLLLSALASPSEVAGYGAVLTVVAAMLLGIWRIPNSMQPFFASLDLAGNRERIRELLVSVVVATSALGLVTGTIFAIFGPTFFSLWLGSAVKTDNLVVLLLSAVLVMHAFRHACLILPFSLTRMSEIARVQVVEGVAKVVLVCLMVRLWGGAGVAVATLMSLACFTMWFIPRFTLRLVGMSTRSFLEEVAGRLWPLILACSTVGILAGITGPWPLTWPSLIATGGVASMLLGAVALFVMRPEIRVLAVRDRERV